MLRLEALRVFVEVAEHGNIKDASDKLFRTTSALSMTLKQIEDRIGSPLFETDRKSSLTEMGRFLYDQAVVLVREFDRAMERIEAQAKGRSGRLRIASVPSVATLLLPDFLGAFLAQKPDLEIDLVDTDSTDVRRLVEAGQVDLGIAGLAPETPGFGWEPIFRDPFRLICRCDNPLAALGHPLRWPEITAPFILNEATRGLSAPGFQRLAKEARLSVRNVASLFALVQAGMGVTLLPALATATLPDGLTALALDDPACRRTVGLCWREGRVPGPAMAEFRTSFARAARARAVTLGLEPVSL